MRKKLTKFLFFLFSVFPKIGMGKNEITFSKKDN
jgi:hypothetical protein